jgi:hypothetical protein
VKDNGRCRIIRKIEGLIVLAAILVSIAVLVHGEGGVVLNGNSDSLGDEIFTADGSVLKFPAEQSADIDSLDIGDDRAISIANGFLLASHGGDPSAENGIEIIKNQESGVVMFDNVSPGHILVAPDNVSPNHINVDRIKAENRDAQAFGSASAANKIKIVVGQQ